MPQKEPVSQPSTAGWRDLYRVAAYSCVIMVLLIPIQIVIFVIWPPPTAVNDWFKLFQNNWLVGLLSLDLLYILNNTLLVPIYLGLCLALSKVNKSYALLALVLGLMGVTAYYASNPAFEMLSLSSEYARATSEAQRAVFLASGQTMLATYRGTAFDVYYILNDIILFIVSALMLRSDLFSRSTAYWGLASAVFMMIPSSAGTIGMIFSLLSLIPWAVFAVLIARRFFQFSAP